MTVGYWIPPALKDGYSSRPHEIAGIRRITAAELNKLPPSPHLSAKKFPANVLDQMLSVRRFQVAPNRKRSGFLVITHLRFFSRLSELQQAKLQVQVEILPGADRKIDTKLDSRWLRKTGAGQVIADRRCG
jgi:hypothetical protein